jgi:hypothetical protein
MTYKNSMSVHKAWLSAGVSALSPITIIARLKNAVKLEIPIGYQDESGFHRGVQAPWKEVKCSAGW